jgi:hypothetical protein
MNEEKNILPFVSAGVHSKFASSQNSHIPPKLVLPPQPKKKKSKTNINIIPTQPPKQ